MNNNMVQEHYLEAHENHWSIRPSCVKFFVAITQKGEKSFLFYSFNILLIKMLFDDAKRSIWHSNKKDWCIYQKELMKVPLIR